MRWRPRDTNKWHKWFAWHPVTCRCGTEVWMETVWRRQLGPRQQPDERFDTHIYALFEDRPDITEDGNIVRNTL